MPGYLLALLLELSHVPRGPTENAEAKQERKTTLTDILYHIENKGPKSILTPVFRTQDLLDFIFEGFRSTFQPRTISGSLQHIGQTSIEKMMTVLDRKYYELNGRGYGVASLEVGSFDTLTPRKAEEGERKGVERKNDSENRSGILREAEDTCSYVCMCIGVRVFVCVLMYVHIHACVGMSARERQCVYVCVGTQEKKRESVREGEGETGREKEKYEGGERERSGEKTEGQAEREDTGRWERQGR